MDRIEKIAHAKAQLASLWHCACSDFDEEEHVYLPQDEPFFEIVTFGSNAVIRGHEQMLRFCKERFHGTVARDILDGENLRSLDAKLRTMGKKLGGEYIRYLHLYPERAVDRPEGFTYQWYDLNTVGDLYGYKEFDNALNFKGDMIALVARDGEQIAAMAGADADMEPLWQIGIDTAPGYRHRGLGAYLVKALALDIESKGKLPFYSTWSANIASTRVALSTGFYPVWMGYYTTDL